MFRGPFNFRGMKCEPNLKRFWLNDAIYIQLIDLGINEVTEHELFIVLHKIDCFEVDVVIYKENIDCALKTDEDKEKYIKKYLEIYSEMAFSFKDINFLLSEKKVEICDELNEKSGYISDKDDYKFRNRNTYKLVDFRYTYILYIQSARRPEDYNDSYVIAVESKEGAYNVVFTNTKPEETGFLIKRFDAKFHLIGTCIS